MTIDDIIFMIEKIINYFSSGLPKELLILFMIFVAMLYISSIFYYNPKNRLEEVITYTPIIVFHIYATVLIIKYLLKFVIFMIVCIAVFMILLICDMAYKDYKNFQHTPDQKKRNILRIIISILAVSASVTVMIGLIIAVKYLHGLLQ